MAGNIDLDDVRKRVTGKLIAIEGVSGVGMGTDRIHVYLSHDDDRVRTAVGQVMSTEASEAPFEYMVTGPFKAQ